jgi:hypothetical protein
VSATLPKRHEAKQLVKLRALRVQRAREDVAKAQEALKQVEEAIRNRQRNVEAARTALENLQQSVVTSLVPSLPRFGEMTGIQRARLAERLERAEYALIEEERRLEGAQEAVQAARAELTRALAREDTVRDLARQAQRAFVAQRENKAEVDMEDLGRHSQRG